MNTNPLASKAMLCTLTTGAWRATKLHKDETAAENTRHGTVDRAKVMLRTSDHPALGLITKLHAEARQEHYRLTLPSCDDGWRFLPAGRELEHSEAMKGFSARHGELASQFMGDYHLEVELSKVRLNGLWRADFFPAENKVADKFKFSTRYLPVPESGTWQDWLREAGAEAENDLRERLHSALAAMAGKLSDPDAIFRDSLVENLADISALAGDLNLTGAADISNAAAGAAADLANLDPQTLRDDKSARATAAARAKSLAAMLAPL